MNYNDLTHQRILDAAEMFANGLMFWSNWHLGIESYRIDKFAQVLLERAGNRDS